MKEEIKDINRLIKKGLFDERLKIKRQKKKSTKSLAIFGIGLLVLFGLCFFIQVVVGFPALLKFISRTTMKSLDSTSLSASLTEQNKPETSLIESLLNKADKIDLPVMNILTLGKPGAGYPGGDLTDTIILIHLEPENKKVVLISLPRDLLVEIPDKKILTKINALYQLIGLDGLKEKIAEITGLKTDRYLLIDLSVVKEVVDLVDGLNVLVPQDINDPYFPGPNYSYQPFVLKAGWRYMDGDMVLKYIRTRYTSPNGDFDRMARQQQILDLLKQKIFSLKSSWGLTDYFKIYQTLKQNIETDLNLDEMTGLWQLAQETKIAQVINLVIDKKETNLLTSGPVMLGNETASAVWPKAGRNDYSEIQKVIRELIAGENSNP